MPRIIFQEDKQRAFLNRIKRATGLTVTELADCCNRHPHTLSDWFKMKTSMSYEAALALSNLSGVPIPPATVIKEDYWHVRVAGRLGGISSHRKHGNPGTPQGRSRGGRHSIESHRRLNTAFVQRKDIKLPPRDERLSEFIGIVLGDGGISYHQVRITLNSKDDKKYAEWVERLISELFDVGIAKTKLGNTLYLTVSGINLVEFLINADLQRGSKIRYGADIPKWIKDDPVRTRACVKGLIDTDGCVYIDRHRHNKQLYKNICLAFTNYSPPLLNSVYEALLQNGLRPKKYVNNIKLRREADVKKYFEVFDSHNPKHIAKVRKYFGEVA